MSKRQYPLPADYFRCPPLTPVEQTYFVQLGDKTLANFIEKTIAPSQESDLKWRAAGTHHGIKLFEGHTRDGRRYEHGVLPFRAFGKVTGTLEEVSALHDFDTREKCLLYLHKYDSTGDLLDMIPLYKFIDRSTPTMHQVYVKWVACQSPVPIVHDRDYLFIETQNEFTLPSGQRGWAFCQHSITLPSVPPLKNHTGLHLIRASLYHTGCVFLENESTPGQLDVTYHIASDFKGAMPGWVRRLGLKKRAQMIGMVNDFIHEQRLSTVKLRTQLECRPKLSTNHCYLCDRSFTLRRPRNCHSCGQVICSRCSKPWRLSGIFLQGYAYVCICHACSNAVRHGKHQEHVRASNEEGVPPAIILTRDRRGSSIARHGNMPRTSSFTRRSSFSKPMITPSRKPSRARSSSIKSGGAYYRPSTSTISFTPSNFRQERSSDAFQMQKDFVREEPTSDDNDSTWWHQPDQHEDHHDDLDHPHLNPYIDNQLDDLGPVHLDHYNDQELPPRIVVEDRIESSISTVDLSYLNQLYQMPDKSYEDSPPRVSELGRPSLVSEYEMPSRANAYDELNAFYEENEESKSDESLPPPNTNFLVQAPPGTTMYSLSTENRPEYDKYGFAVPTSPSLVGNRIEHIVPEENDDHKFPLDEIDDGLGLTDDTLSSLNTSRSYSTSVVTEDDDEKHYVVPTAAPLSDQDRIQRLLVLLAKQQVKASSG